MAVTIIMELHPVNLSGQTLVIHKQSDAGVGMCLSLVQKQLPFLCFMLVMGEYRPCYVFWFIFVVVVRSCFKKLLLMGMFPVSKHELNILKNVHGTIHISLDLSRESSDVDGSRILAVSGLILSLICLLISVFYGTLHPQTVAPQHFSLVLFYFLILLGHGKEQGKLSGLSTNQCSCLGPHT